MKGQQLTDAHDETFFVGIKTILRNKQGEILLLEANSQFGPHWDLPGGKIHKNSTPKQTIERELGEELQGEKTIKVSKMEFLSATFSNFNSRSSRKLIFFLYTCEANLKEIILSNEHLRYAWFSPQKAARLLKVRFGKDIADKIKEL
jgi:8-oxo-dGTP pyrophosphatase MutT (NUDIX family)